MMKGMVNVNQDQNDCCPGSFSELSMDEVEAHCRISVYNDLVLTEAVRPAYVTTFPIQQGYKPTSHKDEEAGDVISAWSAAVTRDKLFELFNDLINPLGDDVGVVLASSHPESDCQELFRDHIDSAVLKSVISEYEGFLLDEGCVGIEVLNSGIPAGVSWDEHKLLVTYTNDREVLNSFRDIFDEHGIPCKPDLSFITDAEHIHMSSEAYAEQFQQFRCELGMD